MGNIHRSSRLESWKEIADHLGVSTRTARRWERAMGMPVHREAGGKLERVYARAEELDAWRYATPAAEEDGPVRSAEETVARERAGTLGASPPGSTRRKKMGGWWRRRAAWPGMALLLAVTGGVIYVASGGRSGPAGGLAEGNPAAEGRAAAYTEEYTRTAVFPGARPGTLYRVTIEESLISGWDREKQLLWTRDFGHPFQPQRRPDYPGPNDRGAFELAILDLEGDGDPETLAILQLSVQSRILLCLDSAGRERWRADPGEPLQFGRTRYSPELAVSWFKPAGLDGDGRRELLAVATHYDFPCKLMILRPDGRCTGQYIHSGHLTDCAAADLEGDGITGILATAINNGSGNGILFVLDSRFPDGCSPQPDTPDYQCRNHPPGVEKFYLRFPRECTSYAWPFAGMANLLIGEDVQAGTHCLLTHPTGNGGSICYRLDRALNLLDRSPNMGFARFHRYLEQRGELDHSYSPACIAKLGPIQYWDGERFVPRRAMNRRWEQQAAERAGARE